MFAKFGSKIKGKGRSERKYVLNEILAIMQMQEDDTSREDICNITGRTKDSLNYKIFEGQTTIKGKTNVRSIKRFWYKNPKSKDSDQLGLHEGLRNLYKHYGVDASKLTDEQLEADVKERIDAYEASLKALGAPNTEAAEGEETEEVEGDEDSEQAS